jgi:hypothetical protein
MPLPAVGLIAVGISLIAFFSEYTTRQSLRSMLEKLQAVDEETSKKLNILMDRNNFVVCGACGAP